MRPSLRLCSWNDEGSYFFAVVQSVSLPQSPYFRTCKGYWGQERGRACLNSSPLNSPAGLTTGLQTSKEDQLSFFYHLNHCPWRSSHVKVNLKNPGRKCFQHSNQEDRESRRASLIICLFKKPILWASTIQSCYVRRKGMSEQDSCLRELSSLRGRKKCYK